MFPSVMLQLYTEFLQEELENSSHLFLYPAYTRIPDREALYRQ